VIFFRTGVFATIGHKRGDRGAGCECLAGIGRGGGCETGASDLPGGALLVGWLSSYVHIQVVADAIREGDSAALYYIRAVREAIFPRGGEI